MLEKAYNPKKYEDNIYRKWEESGYFAPEAHQPWVDNPEERKPFCITMAPPNITGELHLGHALEYTLSDVLVRWKRMQGYETLWLPGTDHAGIATQNVVEKELKKEGLSRHDLGREKFLKRVWEWKEKYGNIIIEQLKMLGVSADWSRTRFTMDEEYQKAVAEAFQHYYEKGWLYKDKRVINWCPRCATSLSDLELEYEEQPTTLYTFRYSKDFPIAIATTRPETKLGDTAVAVHPSDQRYKEYVGKIFKVEFAGVALEIKIVADETVDPEFGTGAVGVTPAHSISDSAMAERHGLALKQVINEDARIINTNPELDGQTTLEAREKIVEWLKENNLLEKKEVVTHNVAVCYRCESVVEPIPSLQWFLKMGELAKVALKAVKGGEVKFNPQRWEKLYTDWLENIRDWNVSRQIWWGHKIPLEGENDVLDTWFSSALWPFAALGWPQKTKDLKKFYPTTLITNDRGIINLWDARMVFSGYEFMGQKPFSDILIHATVMTKEGKRMSKSLGTGIDPLELIKTYGADATRFGLIWQAMGTQDIRWDETAVVAGKKFANKLWNIARYVLARTSSIAENENKSAPTKEDKEILKKLAETQSAVSQNLKSYEFGQAIHELYDFIWHDFADSYLEATKNRTDDAAAKTLLAVLVALLKLLHPFTPFVTEAIWSELPAKETDLLMVAEWPTASSA